MRHTNLNVMNESAIIAGMYESYLDEGLGDLLKKAVDKVKQISAGVKTFMLAQADKISNWVDKNIFEPLKATVSKLVPGYSWGSNKDNDSGLIQSVIQILAKQNNQVLESRTAKFSERKADRISEGIQDYVSTVGNSFINEDKRAIVESGAIGAVLSVIHWSHFAVDVLEAILKVAPSIPFLAGLINKLNKAQDFIKNNPKLAKALDWYEHGKIPKINLPVKDVINAICIAVGIVEICMGGGLWIILSTAASAAWVVMEKIWHHYKKADKEAAKITESFVRGRSKRTRVESRRYFREEDEEDVMEDEDEYEEIEGLHDVDTDEYDDEEDFMDPMYDGDLGDDDNFDDEYSPDDLDLDEDEDSDIDYDLSDPEDEDDSEDPDMDDDYCDPDSEDCDTDEDDYCDPEDEDCDDSDDYCDPEEEDCEEDDMVPAGDMDDEDEESELIERINRLERRIGR